jgi:hypothetical protein
VQRTVLYLGEINDQQQAAWRKTFVQLTQIEAVFRSLKSELCIRPIRHQLEHRADAHILIAFSPIVCK